MSPTAEREYGPPVGDADVAAAARMVHHAFAGPVDGAEKWLREAGLQNVRVVKDGGTAVATLLRVPMGQFFGGRSVPMLGVAGVAVAPEARGRGHARWMMERLVREGRADGFALSCLYPSTQGLYRSVGYEQAGHRFITRLPLGSIGVKERGGEVRPLTDVDDPAVRLCYRRFAGAFDGMLDRGPYVWQRTRATRDGPAAGFGVFASGGELEGYVYLLQARKPETGHHDVTVSDLAFVTAAAGRRLLGFLSDFATVGDEVVLAGGPLHPLLSLIDERRYRVEKKDYWMVRVLDVGRAIGARGVGNGRRAACVVDVDDPLIAESHGRWTVSVAEGQGSAVRGGAAEAVRCGVRTLAALYTGLYSARQAALLGWVTGREEGVDALEGVFAGGGGAWMSDFF